LVPYPKPPFIIFFRDGGTNTHYCKEVIGDYNVNKNLSKLESAIIALQQQLDNAMDAKIQEEIHEELQLLLKFCGDTPILQSSFPTVRWFSDCEQCKFAHN
jgi:hypothetical protein